MPPNRVHLIGSAISSDGTGKRRLLDFDRAAPFPGVMMSTSNIYLPFDASSVHMLVRCKQKPKDDQRLVPHMLPWQVTECERRGLSNSGTEELAKFSKLSAKMVELSLQETRRDPTVRGTVPNELSAVSPPLLWPSTCVHIIAPPAESAGRAGTAAQNPAVAAT